MQPLSDKRSLERRSKKFPLSVIFKDKGQKKEGSAFDAGDKTTRIRHCDLLRNRRLPDIEFDSTTIRIGEDKCSANSAIPYTLQLFIGVNVDVPRQEITRYCNSMVCARECDGCTCRTACIQLM
jgi:hypothetical protein